MFQLPCRARTALLLLPILAVLLVYFPVLAFGKVWDDWLLMGDFPSYLVPSAWPAVLGRPLPFSDNYFRPLVMFTFVLQGYAGLNDFAGHLINIVLHGLNSCLLVCIAVKLWPPAREGEGTPLRFWAALGVGIVFALHPAMSEGVAWMAGRFDLLVTSFMLLAILADTAITAPRRKAVVIGLLFLAALLCKEMAVTLPLILVLLNAARDRRFGLRVVFRRERLPLYCGLLVALVIYLALRYFSLGHFMTREPELAYLDLGSALQRVLLSGAAFAGYLRTLLLPLSGITPLQYTPLPMPVDSVAAWLGLLAMAALCGGFLLWRRKPGARFAVLCCAAAVVSLLPVLHIAPVAMLLGNTLTADRAAMLPLALLLLAPGALAARMVQPRTMALLGLICAAWLAACALIIRVILPIWSDDTALWAWTVNQTPECGICHVNFARQLVYSGREPEALKEATLGLKLAAQPWQAAAAYSEQFQALRKLKRPDEALTAIRAAVATEPVASVRLNYELQLVDLLISTQRLDQAQTLLSAIVARGQGNRPAVVTQLGLLALASDRPDIARSLFRSAVVNHNSSVRKAVLARADDPASWTRLGDLHTAQGATAEAAAAYQEAARLRDAAAGAKNLPAR